MKLESESVGIALTCHLQRNKRKFGNDDRQEWSLIGKIHRESMTRSCKALFRDCYSLPRCNGNVGSVVVVSDPTITMRLSDKDFQFMKDDIK